jgi:hypothetical protein
MPRFKVEISGKHLERAMVALNGAGIPTIVSFGAWYGELEPPEGWQLDTLQAVLDAETGEEAEARVRDSLPADGDYDVGPVEPWGG